MIAHTTVFITPVIEDWLEWEIVQWVHYIGSIRWPTTPPVDALPQRYISLPLQWTMLTENDVVENIITVFFALIKLHKLQNYSMA